MLRQLIPFEHIREQITTLTKVSYNKEHLLPLPNLSDVENIRMVELAQHLVLVNEPRHVTNFALMNSFNRCLFLRESVLGLVDNSETALAHLLLKEILIFNITMPCLDKQTLLYDDILVQPPVNDILL